jgi:hypothetical protein
MSENPQSEESITEEFRRLGINLVSALQTAWEAPERKKLQDELTSGLNELGSTLRREVEQFSSSDTGQRIKGDVEQFGDKIRSAETTSKVRGELIHALHLANSEIQRVIDNWTESESDSESADPNKTASNDSPPVQE